MKNSDVLGKKGIVSIIELVVVLITLFISFNIFFPGTTYKNRWEDAYAVMRARDTVLVLERTGKLHEYAFDQTKMQDFLGKLFPSSNMILWSSVTGGIRGEVKIACNCTNDVISELNSWADRFVLNERNVTMSFCYTDMTPSDSCLVNSDALLIWYYKPLQDFEATLSDYASKGNGIIELMTFKNKAQVDGDPTQKNIFGLSWVKIDNSVTLDYDKFSRKPRGIADITFDPYKYFYHVPIALETTDPGIYMTGCNYNPSKKGFVNFKKASYAFWICNSSYVWFDTNGDGFNDTIVKERDNVTIGGYNFSLSYINSDSSISISFKPSFVFDDFLAVVYDPGHSDPNGEALGHNDVIHLEPVGDPNRILIKAVSTSPAAEYPAVIINKFGAGSVAWVADLSQGGYGDDEKLLLISLLLWSSNKESVPVPSPDLRVGYMASWVNVKNIDMFEMYKFNFGVGYPF